MKGPIQVGDRVAWRSTHPDRQGNYRRRGTVTAIGRIAGYANVKPDRTTGRRTRITIAIDRLTKVVEQ